VCRNCPRACNTNSPFCRKGDLKINIFQLHYGEEPPISGTKGSGTVFFSHCNLRCKFCQNYKISQLGNGSYIDDKAFLDICLKLKEAGAHNLNLVTPTPYADKIIPLLTTLKKNGFDLPVVWNCGGYESTETIKKLDGLVDVYLPDFKYSDNDLAIKLSSAPHYREAAISAILGMRKQVKDVFDDRGEIIKKGLIIRHLVLPSFLENTKGVLRIIKDELGPGVYISLMSQYVPSYEACKEASINRTLSQDEYNEALAVFEKLGFENGFIQGQGAATEEYLPEFKT
jgi:putative pyruvate formate lyase activating enzyme